MKTFPLARTKNIIVQNLGKEVLVYDLDTHKAYNLNETSSLVYQSCDGETLFDDFQRKNKFSSDLIFLGIDELQRNNLLETNTPFVSPLAPLSRREAIRKVGLVSLTTLPVITLLTAPTAAMAASGGGGGGGTQTLGQACASSAQCASSAPNCNGNICCVGSGGIASQGNVGPNSAVGIGTTCADPSTADASCNALYGSQCCSGTAVGRTCRQTSQAIYNCKCA